MTAPGRVAPGREASPLPRPRDWTAEAACRGSTALFFAPSAERPQQRQRREEQARALCLTCPVLDPCRDWAREQREYGFWGGESEEERVAAGYPVALPVGRVARAIRALRQPAAATAAGGARWRHPGPGAGRGGTRDELRSLLVSTSLRRQQAHQHNEANQTK